MLCAHPLMPAKKIPVHYFLQNEFVGTGYQDETYHGKKAYSPVTFWSPNSWAFFCPTCGEIWARGLSTHERATHHVRTGKCPAHGGGSIVMSVPHGELRNLPQTKEFILYELNLWAQDPGKYRVRDLIGQQGMS